MQGSDAHRTHLAVQQPGALQEVPHRKPRAGQQLMRRRRRSGAADDVQQEVLSRRTTSFLSAKRGRMLFQKAEPCYRTHRRVSCGSVSHGSVQHACGSVMPNEGHAFSKEGRVPDDRWHWQRRTGGKHRRVAASGQSEQFDSRPHVPLPLGVRVQLGRPRRHGRDLVGYLIGLRGSAAGAECDTCLIVLKSILTVAWQTEHPIVDSHRVLIRTGNYCPVLRPLMRLHRC